VLNRKVLLHAPFDREWGLVFGVTVLFFMGAEAWKWVKRVYLRKHGLMHQKGEGIGEEDLEERLLKGTMRFLPVSLQWLKDNASSRE
jgi:hypothetical protein